MAMSAAEILKQIEASRAEATRLATPTGMQNLFGIGPEQALALQAQNRKTTELQEDLATEENVQNQLLGASALFAGSPQTRSPVEAARLQGRAERLIRSGLSGPDAASMVAAQAGEPLAPTGPRFTPVEQQNLITGQQNKFLQKIEPTAQVYTAYEQIMSAVNANNALGAQAALVKFAKILDPTSVVREGEVAMVRKGFGLLSELQNAVQIAKGEGFSQEAAEMVRALTTELARPEFERGLALRDEFAGALDTVFDEDVPGLGRIVTGSGLPWAVLQELVRGDGSAVFNGESTDDGRPIIPIQF